MFYMRRKWITSADAEIYESEQRENTKRHNPISAQSFLSRLKDRLGLKNLAQEYNYACNTDNLYLRCAMLFQGILPPLLTVFTKTSRVSMTRNAVWCLSNLCRGKNPPPDFEKISPSLQVPKSNIPRTPLVFSQQTLSF